MNNQKSSQNIIFHQFNGEEYNVDSVLKSLTGKILINDDISKYEVSVLNGKINLENVYSTNFKTNNELYYMNVVSPTNILLKKIQIRERYYSPIQFLDHINSELLTYNISFKFLEGSNNDGAYELTKTNANKLQISPLLYKYFRGLDHVAIKEGKYHTFDTTITTGESIENNRSKLYTWLSVMIEATLGSEKYTLFSNTKNDVESLDMLMSMILNNRNEDSVRNLIYIPDVLRHNIIKNNNSLQNLSLSIKIFYENGIYEQVTIDPGSCNFIQLQFTKK